MKANNEHASGRLLTFTFGKGGSPLPVSATGGGARADPRVAQVAVKCYRVPELIRLSPTSHPGGVEHFWRRTLYFCEETFREIRFSSY